MPETHSGSGWTQHACHGNNLQQVAGSPTCAGGMAVGGRVVPGGMTLWAICVAVTGVQLAVKEMGAVFSSTCRARLTFQGKGLSAVVRHLPLYRAAVSASDSQAHVFGMAAVLCYRHLSVGPPLAAWLVRTGGLRALTWKEKGRRMALNPRS